MKSEMSQKPLSTKEDFVKVFEKKDAESILEEDPYLIELNEHVTKVD